MARYLYIPSFEVAEDTITGVKRSTHEILRYSGVSHAIFSKEW